MALGMTTGLTLSGKLSLAALPRSSRAAMSYTCAASSAVSYDPSQILALRTGSRISLTHFPHRLCLTPLYLRAAREDPAGA